MNNILKANRLFLMGKHKEAFDLYMDIAGKYQDGVAASNIAYMYHYGISVKQDYKKAILYYNTASLEDGGVAYFNMALMYMRGQGVKVDLEKAINLMKRSSDLGCANAKLYLGLAYILGYAYDPVEIECLSLIPFYRVIYRDPSIPLLEGAHNDPTLEDKRYEIIEADGDDATQMYSSLLAQHEDNPYTSRQCAAAEVILGKAYIEGLGNLYDPKRGYKKIYHAAIYHESREAVQYLLANAETAKAYSIDIDRIENLISCGYFGPMLDRPNRNTPQILSKGK